MPPHTLAPAEGQGILGPDDYTDPGHSLLPAEVAAHEMTTEFTDKTQNIFIWNTYP